MCQASLLRIFWKNGYFWKLPAKQRTNIEKLLTIAWNVVLLIQVRNKIIFLGGKMKQYFFLVFLIIFVLAGVFADEIGRVEQNRSTFVVFSPTGSRISSTNLGRGSHSLAGWGRDFFVVQNRNMITTYNVQGRQIATWTSPDPIERIQVSGNRIAVFRTRGATAALVFDRNLREAPGGEIN